MQEGLTKKSGEIEESKIRKKKLETLEHVKSDSNKYLQTWKLWKIKKELKKSM